MNGGCKLGVDLLKHVLASRLSQIELDRVLQQQPDHYFGHSKENSLQEEMHLDVVYKGEEMFVRTRTKSDDQAEEDEGEFGRDLAVTFNQQWLQF